MKCDVDEFMFIDRFTRLRPDNFSIDGLRELYEHLISLEGDDFEYELDVIDFCGKYNESGLEDLERDYPDLDPGNASLATWIELLGERTTVIPVKKPWDDFPSSVIYYVGMPI
jgi:hypothetical protein